MAINRIKAEDEFVVEQKTNWGEGCLKCLGVCCADFENVYYLKAGKETKPFITIKEESSCCSRMMCSPNHEMDLEWKPTAGGDNIVRVCGFDPLSFSRLSSLPSRLSIPLTRPHSLYPPLVPT